MTIPLKKADACLSSTKLINETPWLAHLRPKSDEARWSRISLDVQCSSHQAFRSNQWVRGQLSGSCADLMILDDIEVPGNSMTEPRYSLQRTEVESIPTRKTIHAFCSRYASNDIHSLSQIAERNYRPFVWLLDTLVTIPSMKVSLLHNS